MSKRVAVLKVYPMISAQVISKILESDIDGKLHLLFPPKQ